jgi:heme exporter protein A
MSDYPLQVNNLTCIRGDRRLFTDLSFELQASQLLHLKGRNGTGKTTLQRSLAGLFHPDAGDVLWNGQSIRELGETYYQDMLYIGHAPGIKLELSAAENLRTQCGLRGLTVSEDDAWVALQKLGLAGFEDLPARMLSAGQKRRIALARLFVDKARLWILDEPFTALDVAAVDLLQDILAEHLGTGGMVVLTTHQEVELPDERVMQITLGVH